MIDFTVQAERSLTLAIRQVYADTALLLASPCDWSRMRQDNGKVLWSWVEIQEPSPGFLVFLQPIGLAREIARCVQDVDKSIGEPSNIIQVQRHLTTLIAQRALTDLTLGARALLLTSPDSGDGAPDIQKGHWVGLSFLVNGWWSSVFLRCPGLLLDQGKPRQEETRTLRPSEEHIEKADQQSSALEAKPSSAPASERSVRPAGPPVANVARGIHRHKALNIGGVLGYHGPNDSNIPVAHPAGTGALGGPVDAQGEQGLPADIGHYQILGKLGAGSMGMVLKARHRLLDRVVALKVMRPDVAANHDFCVRFIALGRQAARLEHPNVVTVYDAGNEQGHLYMVLRYFPSGDLPHLIRQHGVMSPLRAIDFFCDCLRGLAFVHAQGLAHGNISPSNLLVHDDGRACIGDVGLTSIAEAPAGQPASTAQPSTLTPAQRADLYALGATLFYALTNRHPFPGTTLSANLTQARAGMPPEAKPLAAIVAIALCDDEQVSYPNAQSFLDALVQTRRALDGKAEPPTSVAG